MSLTGSERCNSICLTLGTHTLVFSLPGYPLPVVLNDQSAAVLPVITTDKAIDIARPLEVPEGISDEYVTANKKVHQDCKFCPPTLMSACSSGSMYRW